MSYSVDANILIYASNEDSSHFAIANRFLQECLNNNHELLCLSWPTVFAYLRIATHPSISRKPLSFKDAKKNIEEFLDLPHVRMISELDNFWHVFNTMTHDVVLRGNAIPDSHLAAILKQNAVKTFYTNDTDFLRYTFLQVKNPFQT